MTGSATPPTRSRRLRWLAIAAAAVALYALLGFLLAPRLLKSAIEEKGSIALHRPVTVREVKVNPFTLSVTLNGLEVRVLAGWESLYVRLAPWKVLRGDLGVAEIRLVRPYGRVALDAQGKLNVQDLLDGEPAPPGAPPPQPAKKSSLGVALDVLEIEEARLVFVDGQREPAFETTLGPLTVRLRDFRTRGGADSPYTFTGATESGETFSWTGTVLSEPLRSSGSISFAGVKLPKYQPYLSEALPGMLLASGTVSLQASYRAEWGAQARVLAVSGLGVKVVGLALARARDRSTAFALSRIELSGGEADLVARTARVAELEVAGGKVALRREPSGKLAIQEMLERRAPAATAAPAPQAAAPASPKPPFRWRVEKLALSGLGVELTDLAAPRPVELSLSDVAVVLTGLSEAPDTACPLTASLRWAGGGTFDARGTVWPFRSRAELALEAQGIDLAPLGAYLEGGALPLRLAAARLGLSLRTRFDGGGAAPVYTAAGDVQLLGLSLRQARGEELLAWRSLELLGLDVASAGRKVSLRTVRLTEPRVRAVVFEDGSTGLGAAPPAGGKGAAEEPAPGPAKAAPGKAPAEAPWRVAVGAVELRRGAASFVDRSVQPPVLLALTEIEGRIADLSSDPRVRSRVDLRAKAPGSAPVSVTGTLNPLQASAFTELAVVAKGVDLSPLDPYAAKHLGYGLRKGKLDVDVTAKVEARELAAANVARLDQLTLGEASSSPDATSLPVRLALALLQDRDGLILLDVPVEGRLDDPELRLGRVIWRTVLNILAKVATSPFSALAALAGGSKEDLSAVDFAPGSAELDEPARQRIALLARALAQRPGVSLELEGTTDPASDGTALRRTALEAQLRQAKPALPEGAPLAPEERARRIEAAFRAAFPPRPPAAGAPAEPPPTPASMEERLLAQVPVAPEALVALGAARTAAAHEALLAAGLEAARLFDTEGGERARKEQGARTWFTVR
ncbi:MAG: DUF748 domain-containing protein [Deltaproteobacteria bacterium]|nr:DUF748 domain-containing protein [Deltaproteobacteria bacterium]